MKRSVEFGLFAVAAAVGGAAFVPSAQAQSLPDLIIEAKDSELRFVSCNTSDPLVEGRIVIRNAGDGDANLRAADNLLRSFVAVYNPENIDLIEKDTRRTKIEPREQRQVEISMGKGAVKTGRNYNGFSGSTAGSLPSDADALKKDKDLARLVQQFLRDRAYSVSVDGDWGSGSKRALSAFQKTQGLPGNGDWNEETATRMVSLIPDLKPSAGNIVNDKGETQITVFAVVDPYNLIDETNESNNLVKYTGWLKCSN
ncbi:MAG: peptidoglycan-binding protein [Alphaproteobacteria bacterium]|nr:peptidoglycan-binding protein [Alphaproteobacteria bacterium]